MGVYEIEGVVPVVHPTAFVHPEAVLIGDVHVGAGAYVGPLASLRGDFGRISLGAGAILRHTAGAITTVLALLLVPVIAIGFLPESVAEQTEKVSLIAAGLAIQQTVETPDNLPLAPWEGLAVVCAYSAVALLLAFWLIAKRDA